MVKDVLKDVIDFGSREKKSEGEEPEKKENGFVWEGIFASPDQFRYRNKMEFTFGDEEKYGPLTLGLHRQYSSHDILGIDSCAIVSPTWNEILKYTQKFYRKLGVPHYNKKTHTGVLRNLVIRQSATDGSILVNLVTTTHHSIDENTRNIPWNEKRSETVDELQLPQYVAGLLSIGEPKPVGLDAYTSHGYEKINTRKKIVRDKKGKLQRVNGSFEDNVGSGEFDTLSYNNKIVGVLYTECDTLADAIIPDSVTLLYGEDYLMEEVLGLKFKISPFSFFQTNTRGSEVLYSKAREYALEAIGGKNVTDNNGQQFDDSETIKTGVIYDLYSGTGTIAQLMAPVAGKVYGIEIVEEAVEAARENAKLNKLTNCEFIAGDVLKKLDEVEEKPDLIILDPPRDGVNPKALQKILSYGVENMVYISCKPTSLARDLEIFEANGYIPVKGCCVDMFPNTQHVEVVSLLQKMTNTRERTITLDVEMEDYHRIKNRTEVTADATECS
ncbi:MAG TPA: 23S rRNA (uracil-5-)-methyltransferase RumA [Lachnospiraceae bacterium]|nr:23S rRNA (uracil-5-)-methyltransferase RumA [Lachnospiraceae bacterium]